MILRRSRFIHRLPVAKDRTLIVHAISHMRLPADRDIGTLVDYFSEPRRIPEDCDAMTALFPDLGGTPAAMRDVVERTVMELLSRQILTETRRRGNWRRSATSFRKSTAAAPPKCSSATGAR